MVKSRQQKNFSKNLNRKLVDDELEETLVTSEVVLSAMPEILGSTETEDYTEDYDDSQEIGVGDIPVEPLQESQQEDITMYMVHISTRNAEAMERVANSLDSIDKKLDTYINTINGSIAALIAIAGKVLTDATPQ